VFRLVRWLFLVVVIAGLAAFIVSAHFRGQTLAQGFCKLAQSYTCYQLAGRGESLLNEAQRRLAAGPPPAPHATQTRESPRVSRATADNAPGEPLDRHTPGERKALSDLLLQHGSR
jgi:hypothetical protein